MTSRPSSISDTEARGYLRTFGLAAVLLLGTLGGISAVSYRFGLIDVATRWIYDYQVNKIENKSELDIVFVGDSSLGNAIDADLFAELTGRPTINLALSGTYGLGASFNMLRRANERHRVRSAVVMQALNTMTRRHTMTGYFFTMNSLDLTEISPIEIAKLYLNYRTAKETIQQVRRRGFKREPPDLDRDYAAQRTRRPGRTGPEEEVREEPLLPGMISSAQIDFVARIAEYCKEQGIRCVYSHGPIYDGYCKAAVPYIQLLNQAITNAGLPVVEGTPQCLPLEDVGDAVDHVISSKREFYTRQYYEQLDPYLKPKKLDRDAA